jgi:hypothetical protein
MDGWTGSDKMYGEAGNDTMLGYSGADSMYGGSGNDKLYGEADNDILYGETGNDILSGGSGSDKFAFTHKGSANKDTITDFSNTFDTIVLTDLLDGVKDGKIKGLEFTNNVLKSLWYFEGAGLTGNGAQLSGIFNNTTTGDIWYNPTSSISGDSQVICKVGAPSTLDNTDFVYMA